GVGSPQRFSQTPFERRARAVRSVLRPGLGMRATARGEVPMANIEVTIREGGVIEVDHEFQPILDQEFVHWRFKNHDDAVTKGQVEFDDAEYFRPGGVPTKTFSRDLSHSDIMYGRPPEGRTFPTVGTGIASGLVDKYTITTYDEDDNEI